MRIVVLMENTPGDSGCQCEHGLSLYIETQKQCMLADTGASGLFLKNAEALGVDVRKVEKVFLSHGHYDHAGGILDFVKINPNAEIYMQKEAVGEYYHKSDHEERYIGIASEISKLSKVIYLEKQETVEGGLEVFSGITGRRFWPAGNRVLKEKTADGFVQDEFLHEQYLVISEGEKKVLVSGCAHNGILNIMDAYRERYRIYPDVVISGFHMMKKDGYTEQDRQMVEETAKELVKTGTKFYTGHCTGEEPFMWLKEIMGEQVVYAHCGMEILL